MKIYISGPMTGLPNLNHQAFHDAAASIELLGHTPLNPATVLGGCQKRSRAEYMREDLRLLLEADAILLLPGWHLSHGARFEVNVAGELGLKLVTLGDLTDDPS